MFKFLRGLTARVLRPLPTGGMPDDPVVKSAGSALAMVVLRKAELPAAQDVLSYVAEHWPSLRFSPMAQESETAIVFDGKGLEMIGLVDAPIPWNELEDASRSAMGWQDASDAMKQGAAHLIVSARGDTALEAHRRTTALAQAACRLTGAIGVYWCAASTVWSAEQFESASAQLDIDDPPYILWIGLKLERESDTLCSGFSVGLKELGAMDVEIQHSARPLSEIYDLLFGIALYLAKNGAVIKDGETVGPSADERIAVSVGPSLFETDKTVYRLDY